ncbi:hypothetical protein [Nonomuraea sp. NPDC050691]|uniref:hypothetical protein n=1 Tax=Nonomuraea sp. NPDC050691 TaxID=3155661 RepID=UPI0033D7F746
MLPLRWRVSPALWGAAFVLTAVPWVASLFASETYGVVMTEAFGSCPGFELNSILMSLTVGLWMPPAPAVVAVGFAVWALLARRGHQRRARAVGWATAVVAAWTTVLYLAPVALDAAIGCPSGLNGLYQPDMLRSYLCDLLVAVLIVLAVRVRRAGPPRRSPLVRVLLALTVVLLVALVARADAARGRGTEASSDACERWQTARYLGIKVPDDAQREEAYLCAARRWDVLTEQDADLPRRQDADAEQARLENERFVSAAKRRCDRLPRHRPRIPAVRTARAALWSEAGVLDVYEEAPGEDFPALDDAFTNHLVGSAPGQLAILTADEAMHVCVTVEAYRRRPPVEVEGWEKVVEVGYRSTTGDLRLTDDRGDALPNLAVGGEGSYRVRVHMRGAEAAVARRGDARQEFVVMVYPGTSGRHVVLRK